MIEFRRKLLKGSGSLALLAPLLGTGLLSPTRVLAADWKRDAFTAKQANEAMKLSGVATPAESRDIVINASEIAENSAKVELEVICNLPNTHRLLVFADKNPMPLCADLSFSGPALPYAKVQLKLAESTRIRAVAKTADGKSYVAYREIKVTLGGCGG